MEIVIIIVLILLNGVLSMSEIALVSARKTKLETEAKKGNRGARKALDLAEEPDRFLSTIQIGITYSLNVDNEKDIVGIVFGIKYSTKEDDMKLLEYSMLVSFKIPELENIISKEGENIHVKDKSIILNLLNISIGTVRGALFLKSKGTIFERFPMPFGNRALIVNL